jgi:hypothetical protein
MHFKHTYLYLKQHATTGKFYFGKTTKLENILTYSGSGTHWKRHLKKHGNDVLTLWFCLFTDEKSLVETASILSTTQNIVESDDFLNLIPENGLDGGAASGKLKRKQRAKEIRPRHRSSEHNKAISMNNGSKIKCSCLVCKRTISAPHLSLHFKNSHADFLFPDVRTKECPGFSLRIL